MSAGTVATGAEENDGRKVVGTIDLTPTWRSLIPVLIAALEDGTPEGKRMARENLFDLADAADHYIAVQKDRKARGVKTRYYFAFREQGQTVHINAMGELPYYSPADREAQFTRAKTMADDKSARRYYGPIEVVECASTYDATVVHTATAPRPSRRKRAE